MNTSPSTARRILLVDDDRDVLLLLSNVLTHAGFAIAKAYSGEEGLRLAIADEPDLVILDVNMGGMSGLEVAQQLQSETDVAFMFITVRGEIEIVRQATKSGAAGYLVKPVDPMQIVPAVEAAMARAAEIASLTKSLNSGRETNMAIGLLMAKHQVDQAVAFEVLRDFARSNRRKMNEVAHDLLQAESIFNHFKALFAAKGK